MVERSRRRAVLVHLDRDRTAAAVNLALIAAFGAPPPQPEGGDWAGRTVLLVEDVITTGASLNQFVGP